MKRTVFLRIFSGYALVIALIFLSVAIFTPRAMKTIYLEDQKEHLDHAGTMLAPQVRGFLASGDSAGLRSFVGSIGKETGIRFTVIDPKGTVLADSNKEPADMENHLYREEIFPALKGEKRTSIRRSSTLQAEMMYMSIPVEDGGRVIGVLRLSKFMKEMDVLFGRLRGSLTHVLLAAILVAGLAAALLGLALARPISETIEASSRVAGGDLRTKMSTRQISEFRCIAESFNAMTDRLRDQFAEINDRNSELAAVLSSVREGLCLIDHSGRVLLANPSMKRITNFEKPEGHRYIEVILSSEFAGLFKKAFETGAGATGEIALNRRTYLVSLTLLPGGEKAVAVFHDLTERRGAERMKKDFVVNVSHELKTPLAAVKGFIETMQESADDKNRPYLEVVMRNIDRLNAIIDDLLYLSELEAKAPQIRKEKVDAGVLAGQVMAMFAKTGAEKGLEVSLEKPDRPLMIDADSFQIERLLVNLLDNAVKYTDKGRVVLRLGEKDGRVSLEVADTGIGIDADHIDRVFERFYVVDKSRSRKSGGTGLGLSIVKHIAEVHGGTVGISSRIGEGTTVTVILPAAA